MHGMDTAAYAAIYVLDGTAVRKKRADPCAFRSSSGRVGLDVRIVSFEMDEPLMRDGKERQRWCLDDPRCARCDCNTRMDRRIVNYGRRVIKWRELQRLRAPNTALGVSLHI